jgi:hypothetical protein
MNLTREQDAALGERIGPWVNYIVRLRERMTKVGFALTDPINQSVMKAEQALREVWITLHYMSCAGGVGEPAEEVK